MVDILRIVLRKGGQMIAEYDLVRKKWLQSAESSKGKNAKASLRSYRIRKGFQMTRPALSPEPEILVISDLHLGHRNSIPRYKRPFFCGNIHEMDRVIIRNWNWSVKESDIVIFLGDLSFMSEEKPESYLGKLGGSIFYLEEITTPTTPTCRTACSCAIAKSGISSSMTLKNWPGRLMDGSSMVMSTTRIPHGIPSLIPSKEQSM
jgi:hypothetical protein